MASSNGLTNKLIEAIAANKVIWNEEVFLEDLT